MAPVPRSANAEAAPLRQDAPRTAAGQRAFASAQQTEAATTRHKVAVEKTEATFTHAVAAASRKGAGAGAGGSTAANYERAYVDALYPHNATAHVPRTLSLAGAFSGGDGSRSEYAAAAVQGAPLTLALLMPLLLLVAVAGSFSLLAYALGMQPRRSSSGIGGRHRRMPSGECPYSSVAERTPRRGFSYSASWSHGLSESNAGERYDPAQFRSPAVRGYDASHQNSMMSGA
jgi:hypothetical protein